MPKRPVLSNTAARKVFMHRHLLGTQPQGSGRGSDLMSVIRGLGFVQVDSVNTVERAHHMILFARRPSYRPANLTPLLERDRLLFEHWTHDASVIPTEFFPWWQLRFSRDKANLVEKWDKWQGTDYVSELQRVREHIAENGPVRSSEMMADAHRGQSGGWWNWHPSKTALEYLWRTGELSVCRRIGFQKVYDLTENVFPQAAALPHPGTASSIDWLCEEALLRLGFATSGQIASFWGHVSPAEAKTWCQKRMDEGEVIEMRVESAAGGSRVFYALPDIFDEAEELEPPPSRLRILSPFDPLIRDRNRTEMLFGYHYRIEIFVPESRRMYGYYVFPMLEGDKLIGRIDMKADQDRTVLKVTRVWMEEHTRMSKGRFARLESELIRMARFAGLERVEFARDWLDD
ncbi:winged helix-turn-helix domain-containing protein [Pseudooceanicola sp. 216_PA32_1]|jgi:uncharacterized protein|uniref:Winged helix-turn-helix domain-containing protein n=1 Tax=Pseudooceanicola pacificus TaxID=2676438 RepID=A0A844W1L4_9RHOB|nr:crosslink repair DNA glycosylase YcaQ family protein [Pseudooceanicola pacificus]MWB76985.1 winged helix-turn-helix domain-containing protein [Pseudooceanicola pacificus]